MIDVHAGILERDREEIMRLAALAVPHVSWIHIDVADNTLVSNETFVEFPLLDTDERWQHIVKKVSLEAHVMVEEPEKYIEQFVEAGFSRIIAHVESQDPRSFLAEVRSYDCEAGLAIDADTEVDMIEPFIEEIDTILVMTVDAGFSGQPFRQDAVDKIKVFAQDLPDIPLTVDGHIDADTAKVVKEAGATRLVSTSYLFSDEGNIAEAVANLKNS